MNLNQIESKFGRYAKEDWSPIAEVILDIATENPDDCLTHIRCVYGLHNILLEEDVSINFIETYSPKLLTVYQEGQKRFPESPDYLFFVGSILHIAEWYFGLNDDIKPMKDRLAFRMTESALGLEPKNLVFQWGHYRSRWEIEIADRTGSAILAKEGGWLTWLESFAFLGEYIKTKIITSLTEAR